MHIRAAILWEQGQPLLVEPADLSAPGPGEVLVEVKAAGVCHSDLHPARGDWPARTPLLLGRVGAVARAARVPPGARVVIIGTGGVGLNVVQGAAIAGCERIVAIDRRPAPLALARAFGATDTIEAGASVPDAVRALTGGRGADY